MKILREWLGGAEVIDLSAPDAMADLIDVHGDEETTELLIADVAARDEVFVNYGCEPEFVERYTRLADTFAPVTQELALIARLAEMMDDCADSDGQWDGGDVCDGLARIIGEYGGWKSQGGLVFAATKDECPFGIDTEGEGE